MDFIVRKTAEDLEREKKLERKQKLRKLGGAVWLLAGLGLMFGGMFAGINWLVITGLAFLFGGALVLSAVLLAVFLIKQGKESYEKYGGSKTAYIMKAVVCCILIAAGVAFTVLAFIFSTYYIIGAIVAFGAMIVIVFAWQPSF